MSFKVELEKKLQGSINNNYGKENFDEQRFGTYPAYQTSVKQDFKNQLKKLIGYKKKEKAQSEIHKIDGYEEKLAYVWNHLDKKSQELFVDIVAYKILGYKKVKLPINNKEYWEGLERAKSLKKGNDSINPNFLHFKLERFDLHPLGYDVELFFLDAGVSIDFIIEQYAYKSNNKYLIQVEKGDVVLDIGACWGDTALYFADKVGENGKVFSFEFIPDNLKLYNTNVGLNPQLGKRIKLVEHPVSDISGEQIFYLNNGPGSYISSTPFEKQTGTTTTISIDDFVERYKISKIDFIKMDIEGAEPAALRGAINTIKKFKPKLAIAIYHSIDDFVNIPKWLIDLNLGYEFFIGHYTIHSEETVLYAKPIIK